ncbi:MAG: cytochrome b [Rubrimonas sp.]|uniref:cytochrome b n=1 Tax=Rubrimonas sp. TaxID=2036015 RepID=UPI002FDE757F
MSLRNTDTGWGWPARLLHWAVAAIILFQLGLGLWMANFVDDLYARFALTQTHKSWGALVFGLAALRLAWRMANPVAPAPPEGPRWEKAAGVAAHWALYALMIALPVSGWLMASASPLQDMYGVRNMVFGLFEMPDPFVPGDAGLEAAFRAIHTGGAAALTLLLLVHAGAALRHHFVLRDAVLRRMIRG